MKKIFDKYVKSFDMKQTAIVKKYYHSYRVLAYAIKIGKSLKLDRKSLELLKKCALLHDIARFKQYTDFQTFSDLQSFDHGDKGYEILSDNHFIEQFSANKEEQDIILFSVKNHNKKEIASGTDKQVFYTKIVRDADKLDIMFEQGNSINDDNLTINEEMLKDLNDNKLCSNRFTVNQAEHIIRMLSFIYDINFSETYKIILKKKIIEHKIKTLKKHVVNVDLDLIEQELISYVQEQIKRLS